MTTRDPDEVFASVFVDFARCLEVAPRMLPEDFGPGGRYRLEELIGLGRDSHVYRAVDRHLSKPTRPAYVAIKIRASQASTHTEALVGRSVLHDNVVRIIDHGIAPDGASYIVQEWVDGGDLTELPLPLKPREAVRLLIPIAHGVQALHSAGNIHGDLKPSNILRTADGTPKVTDFDLASAVDLEEYNLGGNAAFMPPERLLEESSLPSPSADIFALGGLLYYFLTGRLPHGDDREQIVASYRAGRDPDIAEIEPDLGRICLRALARGPSERYRSAEALAGDLELWLGHWPIPGLRPSPLRRAKLLCRRRPLQVALSLLILTTLLAAAGWVRVSISRDIEAKRQAIDIANAELERIKATLRGAVEQFVRSAAMSSAAENGTSDLTAIVWIDYFVHSPIFGTDGPTIAREERARLLGELREQFATNGEAGSLVDGLTAYALAHTLLESGEPDPARAHLEDAAASILGSLPPDDRVRRCIDALGVLAAYLEASQAPGADASEARRELLRVRDELTSADASHAIARLIDSTLDREKQAAVASGEGG